MSKLFRTKQKILDILSTKEDTLTAISKKLGLAPSTVSQHLKELVRIGTIEPIDNPYFRKWKFYRMVKTQQVNEMTMTSMSSESREAMAFSHLDINYPRTKKEVVHARN